MDRRNKVFLIVLVLQLAVIGYLFRPATYQVSEAVVKIYAGLQVAQVSDFVITDGTDNKHLKIVRTAKHGWQLRLGGALPPYPADRNKVEAFLGKILALQSSRLVTRTKSSHQRLQIAADEFNRQVQLNFADGEQRTLYLGTSPNYNTTHVRDAEHDEVYLVNNLSAWEASTDTSSWWENRYVNVNEEDIVQLQIKNLNGSFLLKNISGSWQFVSTPPSSYPSLSLDSDKFANLIDIVSHINMTDIINDKQKIPSFAPAVSVTITTAKKTLNIDFWTQASNSKDVIVKSSDSIFYILDTFSDISSLVSFPRSL